MSVLGPLLIVLLSCPGLFAWWLLHNTIDPDTIRAIPAPRWYTEDVEINPTHNDWRGMT